MPSYFPPQPVYPIAIDSDYTLYLVHNTSETTTTQDNEAWEEEISIKPVGDDKDEIWPLNGFATINGEMFYYDDVKFDENGKVNVLMRCARNLGGSGTSFNPSGTWVRGFVIAEHHNQLVDAILSIEDFVGINFDSRQQTLDYRIRNLRETPVIFDDFTCPDVTLDFEVTSNDPSSGITASYLVQITGTYNSYRLDFGDGSFTTSSFQGTHQYAPNSTIDPVVTVSNSNCQIIQTPIQRSTSSEPNAPTTNPPLVISIPNIPDVPSFVYEPITLPPPDIQYPPIVLPCIDLSAISGFSGISIGDINVQVPSIISFTPLNIPSEISITPVNIPPEITISPSTITFIDPPNFSPIGFGPAPVFAPIGFAPAPVIAPIDINFSVNVTSSLPSCISLCAAPEAIEVDWGSPPVLNVAFVQPIRQDKKRYTQEEISLMKELGEDYRDFFPEADMMEVEYSPIGLPSEITIIPPSFPPIKIEHDLPAQIEIIKSGDLDLGGLIEWKGPEIPKEIEIISREMPSEIRVISDLPSIISIDHPIPDRIIVEAISTNIPDTITIDGSGIPETIQVIGIPETIQLIAPPEIRLTVDEDLEIPLVYKGPPIETVVKLEMPKEWKRDKNGDGPCVMLVPCP